MEEVRFGAVDAQSTGRHAAEGVNEFSRNRKCVKVNFQATKPQSRKAAKPQSRKAAKPQSRKAEKPWGAFSLGDGAAALDISFGRNLNMRTAAQFIEVKLKP